MRIITSIAEVNLITMLGMDALIWSTVIDLKTAWRSFCPMSNVYKALEKSSALGRLLLISDLLSEDA